MTPGPRPGAGGGVVALLALALVGQALPEHSRLAAAGRAAWQAGRDGGSGWQVLRAVLRSGDPRLARSPAVAEAWSGTGLAALAPPPAGAPAEAALLHAQELGWVRCEGDGAPDCRPLFLRLARALPPDLALEAVVLGDPDGNQVLHAVAVAKVAGLEAPEDVAVHAAFLSGGARARVAAAQRVLGLATLWSLKWPVDAAVPLTSPYGERVHPVLKERRFHDGVDLATPSGTPLRAAAAGRVLHVGQDSVSGTYVVLDHGHGVHTVSCHLSEATVARRGSVVDQQVYARTGATGRVTGPHLHFGVRLAGQSVDPVAAVQRQAR